MANSRFSTAVHILALLAENRGSALISSEFLAKSVNTNPVVIRRLLRNLNEAGLVVSQTGANGGSKLIRDVGEVNLYEIYRAVQQGEIIGLPRQTPNQKCDVGRHIQHILCDVQSGIDAAVERRLAQINLSDIVQALRKDCRAENAKNDERSSGDDMSIWLM